MKNKFNNVHDIALRRIELKYEIKTQEEKLSRDFDDYQDEWESVCNAWNFFFNRKKRNSSNATASHIFNYVSTGYQIISKIIRFFKKKSSR